MCLIHLQISSGEAYKGPRNALSMYGCTYNLTHPSMTRVHRDTSEDLYMHAYTSVCMHTSTYARIYVCMHVADYVA